MASLIYSVILFCFLTYTPCGSEQSKNNRDGILNVEKRELNWNTSGYLVSSNRRSFQVLYLKPHSRCEAVDENVGASSFILYMRNGQVIENNTGIFHFVNTNTVRQLTINCPRQTYHARAYYHFYNRCPEDDNSIVASGFCYDSGNSALGFHSLTFNSQSQPYLDTSYYLQNGNPRNVHAYEQRIITHCYNSWKNERFPVNSVWRCPTSGIVKRSAPESRFKRETGICSSCTCDQVVTSDAKGLVFDLLTFGVLYYVSIWLSL